jgi:16S rRNA G966 N2-methylase RsmD
LWRVRWTPLLGSIVFLDPPFMAEISTKWKDGNDVYRVQYKGSEYMVSIR